MAVRSQAEVSAPNRKHDFRLYFGARAVSVSGSAVSGMVLPIIVYDLTRSPLLVGVYSAINGLVYALAGLYAGVLADRLNRRTILLVSDIVRAIVIASIPLTFWISGTPVAVVFVAAVICAAFFTAFDAANQGVLKTIVGANGFAAATGSMTVMSNAAEVVVPAATGLLIVIVNPPVLLLADALSFALAAMLVLRIRTPLKPAEGPRERVGAAMLGGVTFVWRDLLLRATTVAGAGQALADGMVVGQLVVFADVSLGVAPNDARVGVLYASLGAGGVIAGLLLNRLTTRMGELKLIQLCLLVSTLLLVLIGLSQAWLLAAVALFAWAAAYLLVFVGGITYRQIRAPDRLQGRVSALGRLATLGVGVPLGAFAGGVIADITSPQWTIFASAITTAATLALVYWLCHRAAHAQGRVRDPQ